MKRRDDPPDFNEADVRSEDMRLCSLHHKWLKEIFVVLRGNGDVRHGMEWKIQQLLDRQRIINRLIWIVVGAVLINIGRVVGIPFVEWLINMVAHYHKG